MFSVSSYFNKRLLFKKGCFIEKTGKFFRLNCPFSVPSVPNLANVDEENKTLRSRKYKLKEERTLKCQTFFEKVIDPTQHESTKGFNVVKTYPLIPDHHR